MSKPTPLVVTDHAIVRYCERVLGLDMEAIRQTITETCAGPAAVGARRVIKDKFTYEMQGHRVVTVAPYTGHMSATSRRLAVAKS